MAFSNFTKAFVSIIFNKLYCLGKDNGFGPQYVWAGSLESGLEVASYDHKPVMVIIHKSWCPACKKLKSRFAESAEIESLSPHFVMVNLIDEEEPKSNTFAPDGTYIPRIFFVSPTGSVDHDIYNEEGSRQFKYFYSRPEHIAKSMRKVLQKYNKDV
ncbi:thioredoxin domain-containing protein 12-like [Aricia agestis]|uniref:thioredoxin domain-containing protein 12-like n=1 Tax=Aricia agestis TaxID=91739 RepID=UPI001C20670A|nr:thioredoxin domain-containing protein 12-like [Aricia agestis]